MDAFAEFLSKFRDKLPIGNGRGWNGCTCRCHMPDSKIVHVVACCEPSEAEIAELMQLFRNQPKAQALLQHSMAEALHNLTLNGLGSLGGLFKRS
jgi:hypothetical protein